MNKIISKSNIIGRNRQIQYLLLAAIAVLFPFFQNVSSILIFLVFILWLIEGNFREKWKIFSARPANWLMIGFFLLHAISLFYSNTATGLPILERRMSLLVFPIVLGSAQIPHAIFRKICYVFTGMILISSIIAVGYGIYSFYVVNTSDVLFYHELVDVLGLSAIFMSYLLTFALLILLHFGVQKWYALRRSQKWLVSVSLLWLLLFLVLLSSKMFLFINYIFFSMYILYLFGRKHWKRSLGSLLAFNVLIVLLVLLLPQTRQRIERAINTDMQVVHYDEYQSDTDFTGLSLRLVFWRLSLEIVERENAWIGGLGIGDAQDELNQEYEAYNIYTGNPELGDKGFIDFNTHSQYFQLLLELGLLGLLCWLVLLLYSLLKAIYAMMIIPFLFILMMMFFGVTEAFLDRHIGIIFFCFFYCLLFYNTGFEKKQLDMQ